ncbi:hypothetical protein N9I83_01635 [bacterium]|nr:hypothetical protein [bacterium]
MNDLDVCRSLLNIIDEMYEADGITPVMPAPDPREEAVTEAMSDAYGVDSAESQETEGSVEFKQHKSTDKGSLSIEASADNMEELQKIMQLAGLSLPSLNAPADDEPEEEDVLVSPEQDDEESCGDDNVEVSVPGQDIPSDAKQTLVNIIKDKLQQRLK